MADQVAAAVAVVHTGASDATEAKGATDNFGRTSARQDLWSFTASLAWVGFTVFFTGFVAFWDTRLTFLRWLALRSVWLVFTSFLVDRNFYDTSGSFLGGTFLVG